MDSNDLTGDTHLPNNSSEETTLFVELKISPLLEVAKALFPAFLHDVIVISIIYPVPVKLQTTSQLPKYCHGPVLWNIKEEADVR